MPPRPCIVHEPRWQELGPGFSDRVEPARFPQAILRFRNQRQAARVGLDILTDQEWQARFHAFEPMRQNLSEALALRYHGHQFQTYNPQLGDGRGFLYAQLRDLEDGRLLDLATKGSGTTPYSRGGDGRLTLKGGVREILAASLLEALGVYTSKAFSVFETGEALYRGDEPSPTRSCVLVRLGHSHLRFGTFQRHAHFGDRVRLERLVDYAIDHLLPEAREGPGTPADRLLAAVTRRSARLAAEWMAAGFVHGVLNTDNMVVTGESFDYGPWRFLPRYDPTFTAAYFDYSGLYCFGQQPRAVLWNLARLAESLTGLLEAPVEPLLEGYNDQLAQAFLPLVARRLGLRAKAESGDERTALGSLADATYALLAKEGVPFDALFHDWWGGAASEARAWAGPRAEVYEGPAFLTFRRALERFSPRAPERLEDPYFARAEPEGLLYEEVEAIWAPIAEHDDWSRLEAKLRGIEARRVAERLDGGEAGRPEALR